jgi:uroporphyrinogen-III decarboxylase
LTTRENLLALLRREKPEWVPWFGDLDYWATALITKKEKPQDFKSSRAYIDWHRDLGLGYYLQGYFPFNMIYENCEIRSWSEGHKKYTEYQTPKGNLRTGSQYLPNSFSEAIFERLLKSPQDLAVLRFIYENMRVEPDYDFAKRRQEQIGDDGILLCYLPKSPFMQLVVYDAGIEAVTYMAIDAPDEFEETLAVIRRRFDRAAQIALQSPAEALMIPENLSSEVVGRHFYERYMRDFQVEWTEKIALAGKFSFIHMDGLLQGLIKQVAEAGFDVLEALTPKPVGDVAIEQLGETVNNDDVIIWGGLPGVYFTDMVDDNEFTRHVKEVLSVMRAEPRYVLGVADQIPPDCLEDRVRKVNLLVQEYGVY